MRDKRTRYSRWDLDCGCRQGREWSRRNVRDRSSRGRREWAAGRMTEGRRNLGDRVRSRQYR